jgi:endogenous inhibitor of DNA gyrase (YacG/DUF329 family)
MNQIRFDCPGCGQTIEMAEEAQFERVKCPTCQHEFFPDKTRLVRPARAAPPPESASPPPPLPIQQRAMKLINCPACGLQISPQAASCPGCGQRTRTVKIIFIIVSVILSALFAFWREAIAERDDVGYFQWPVLIVTFIFALLAIFIYMIPSILAEECHHRNLAAIVVLNLLLGWTFLGWVGALIWAIIRPRQPE